MAASRKKKSPGKWVDKIMKSIGSNVHFETHDGSVREGKVTGLNTRTMVLNGEEVDVPMSIEMNGDSYDTINFDQISKMDID